MPSRTNEPIDEATRALLDRARRYCAHSEQCESGMRQKLITWGAPSTVLDAIISRLRADDYINDFRYAAAYCRGKLVGQRWGRQKVLYQLRAKHLPKDAIEAGMAQVDDETYFAIMNDEAAKKLRQLGGGSTPDNRRRLVSFLVSRGYTPSEIARLVDSDSLYEQ